MANEDPYAVLGVAREASAAEIRKAYRALAKKHHPDLHSGDARAEARFKRISAAYDLLGDAKKRARFDRGEIDASGAERGPRHAYRHYAGADAAQRFAARGGFGGFGDMGDFGDVFSDLFGDAGRGRRGRRVKAKGADVAYQLTVSFLEAVKGAKKRVSMPDGKRLDVAVPPGTREGQTLRLKGKGTPGVGGGRAGDALVKVTVTPHPSFEREGDDIRLEVPVSLPEAIHGARIQVPTPTGAVSLRVPKGSNSGTVLRLKGKGVARPKAAAGHLYVRLAVALPDKIDPELERLIAEWAKDHPYDPRGEAEG